MTILCHRMTEVGSNFGTVCDEMFEYDEVYEYYEICMVGRTFEKIV